MAIKEQRLVSLVYAVTIDPKFKTTLIARDIRSAYELERVKIGRSIKSNFIIAHGTIYDNIFVPRYFYAYLNHRLAWRSTIFPLWGHYVISTVGVQIERLQCLDIPFSTSNFSISVLLSTTATERSPGTSEKYCFAPSPLNNRRSYRPRRSGPQRISNLSPRSSHPSEFILTVSQSVYFNFLFALIRRDRVYRDGSKRPFVGMFNNSCTSVDDFMQEIDAHSWHHFASLFLNKKVISNRMNRYDLLCYSCLHRDSGEKWSKRLEGKRANRSAHCGPKIIVIFPKNFLICVL